MKYEDMGDIAIDRKIFEIKFGSGDKDMERIWKQNKFRPCSNAANSWEIINEYGISLVFMPDDNPYYEAHYINPETDDEDFHSKSENGLRAAMICFLKIKDAENEPSNSNPASR
jgi:hypothetical protein